MWEGLVLVGSALSMKFPRAVVAHRWQSWLLVTAFLAVVVTGLLVWDLTRNLKTVVISETNRSLANAVNELYLELRQTGISPESPGILVVVPGALKHWLALRRLRPVRLSAVNEFVQQYSARQQPFLPKA